MAYIDFSAQEIAIAAALSGDGRMAEASATGDPHIGFAKVAGLVSARTRLLAKYMVVGIGCAF